HDDVETVSRDGTGPAAKGDRTADAARGVGPAAVDGDWRQEDPGDGDQPEPGPAAERAERRGPVEAAGRSLGPGPRGPRSESRTVHRRNEGTDPQVAGGSAGGRKGVQEGLRPVSQDVRRRSRRWTGYHSQRPQ